MVCSTIAHDHQQNLSHSTPSPPFVVSLRYSLSTQTRCSSQRKLTLMHSQEHATFCLWLLQQDLKLQFCFVFSLLVVADFACPFLSGLTVPAAASTTAPRVPTVEASQGTGMGVRRGRPQGAGGRRAGRHCWPCADAASSLCGRLRSRTGRQRSERPAYEREWKKGSGSKHMIARHTSYILVVNALHSIR